MIDYHANDVLRLIHFSFRRRRDASAKDVCITIDFAIWKFRRLIFSPAARGLNNSAEEITMHSHAAVCIYIHIHGIAPCNMYSRFRYLYL